MPGAGGEPVQAGAEPALGAPDSGEGREADANTADTDSHNVADSSGGQRLVWMPIWQRTSRRPPVQVPGEAAGIGYMVTPIRLMRAQDAARLPQSAEAAGNVSASSSKASKSKP